MSNSRDIPIGIDLGTTFSAIARLDDAGRPQSIVNAEGDLLTPSVVLFDGEDIIVGKEAVKALSTDAERIADLAKRDLGSRIYHRQIEGNQYPPEAILALVLRKVKNDAANIVGPFTKAVITVPAYFDEVRRKSVQDAGYLAGLDVLDIINEPTSAAIAFGFQEGFLNPAGSSHATHRVLVYDLGGGTFDVTVMEIKGTEFVAIATDGDVQLGGRDWDKRLVDYVCEQFMSEHGIDPREDPCTAGRLWRECEDVKRTLSARSKTSMTCDYKGRSSRVEVTRDKFEELTHDLLARTEFTTRQTLKEAGFDWSAIDRVLLVGGSSRMPAVREQLRRMSGKEPDASVAADEAVAHGAALRAGLILSKQLGEKPRFEIKNINSHSLGIIGTDPQTKQKRNAVLIKRNTQLPVAAKRVFRTANAGQKSVVVKIVEGESPQPDACTPIGRLVIRDLPPNLPARTPITVKFVYDTSSRLTVNVGVEGTDRQVQQEIIRDNGLSQELLDSWREWITSRPS